jgi:hypothetical protein
VSIIVATGLTLALGAVAIYSTCGGWFAAREENALLLTFLGLVLVPIGAAFIMLAVVGRRFAKYLRLVFFLAPGLASVFAGLAAIAAGYSPSAKSDVVSWFALTLCALSTLAIVIAYVVILVARREAVKCAP